MWRFLAILLLGGIMLLPTPAWAATTPDFAIPDGHWYTQTNGVNVPTQLGYGVRDTPTIKLWSEFQRLGGVAVLGYPVSFPYLRDGFVEQAFQKAILQWQPLSGRVAFVNVFDLLHAAGKDDYLLHVRQIPPPLDTASDTGKSWPQVVAAHQSLLDANAAIRAAYLADADPISHYGLPMTAPVDEGNVLVVRCQRAVFQQWKQAMPWAAAGQVTIANGGDLAKETGLLPTSAAEPFGPSFRWNAVQGGPVRMDAWEIGLALSELPSGYTLNTPSIPTSDASGSPASATANPAYIARSEGPFVSFIHPGLVNASFLSFVQNQSAETATGAILIENITSTFDTPADAAQDYALRVQRLSCCVQPVSVGPIGDGAIGAIFPGHLTTGVKFSTYGVEYHQANVTGYVLVTYAGAPGTFDLATQLTKVSLSHLNPSAGT